MKTILKLLAASFPYKPVKEGFIVAPGCIDMAVKGNMMYLDNYFFRKVFVNLDADYTYFDVRKNVREHEKLREDGLDFYRYSEVDKRSFFNKITTSAAVGIHSSFQRIFFAEPYFGTGLAYSFYDRSYGEKYNETMFGFGHRFFYWVLGVKLGFNIPPSRSPFRQ